MTDSQNGPVVACEYKKHIGWVFRVRLSVPRTETNLARVALMMHACFAELTPTKPSADWDLEFNVKDTVGSPSGATPESLNAAIRNMGPDPVLRIVRGNIPMQVLVALTYRPRPVHMDHLLKQLRAKGVLHVSYAEPRGLYNHHVLGLLVPAAGDDGFAGEVEKSLHAAIREALSFELEAALRIDP